MIMKRFWMFLLPAMFAVSCNAQNEPTAKSGNVKVEKAQEMVAESEVVILDVRTPNEYENGHLENAQLVNYNAPDFESQLEDLDKEKSYLVYCHSGNRSGKAFRKMKEMGFEKVYNLEGGISAWQAENGEISR